MASSSLRVHVLRVRPGQDLVQSLKDLVSESGLRAPFILSCVGSVTSVRLRLASATAAEPNQVLDLSGPFEILSLVGTLNPEAHLHLCVGDSIGRCVGGHVLGPLPVLTTAEVVVGEAPALCFSRHPDPQTGFNELVVEDRDQDQD
ncbi:unnamed protein product [Knipowitschia caucasica]|uniref:PPC domain-containing protein n=1 Tax=Knipowitschia caucasica TaxID=637954 RepID=A0AAV2K6T3_KNICA